MKFVNWEMLSAAASLYHPDSYLEVGVLSGSSLRVVLDAWTPSRLTLCDSWSPRYAGSRWRNHDHIVDILRERNFRGAVTYLDGDSHELLAKLSPSEAFELIHVDGDHSEAGAFQDMEDSWRVLQVAGIMVVDDLLHAPAVYTALKRFCLLHPDSQIVSLRLDKPDGCAMVKKNETR